MQEIFTRTELLLGKAAMKKLNEARVAIFGIGGVGGYVCEALIRSGIQKFDLIDSDTVDITNLNRQIIALHSTIGRCKVDVMKERMSDINPEADIRVYNCFFLPENADQFPFDEYDYVVDAVDTVTAKIELIIRAQKAGVPIISAMGAGNKLNASGFFAADIYDTKVCPLAKVMRRELKKRGVKELKVVYSEEEPLKPGADGTGNEGILPESEQTSEKPQERFLKNTRRSTPGSIIYAPAVAGLTIAAEVIKDLIKQ